MINNKGPLRRASFCYESKHSLSANGYGIHGRPQPGKVSKGGLMAAFELRSEKSRTGQ